MTRQSRHRLKKRSEGICGREGCENSSPTKYYCEACGAIARDRALKRYHVRKAIASGAWGN